MPRADLVAYVSQLCPCVAKVPKLDPFRPLNAEARRLLKLTRGQCNEPTEPRAPSPSSHASLHAVGAAYPYPDPRRLAPSPVIPSKLRVEIGARTVALVVGAIGGVWVLLRLWPVLLVIVVALMVVGLLSPFITGLERRGLRRGHAIGIVFVGMLVAAGLFVALAVPQFVAEISDIAEQLPKAQAEIAQRLEATKFGAPIAKALNETHSSELMSKAGEIGLAYSSQALEVFAYAVTSLFLALYLIVDRDRMRGTVFALVPRKYHVRVSRVLLGLETIVGGYWRGQIITSVMMTVFTLIVLSVAHVHNAVALSLFAGIVDVLPYVGALLACGPAFFASLSQGTTVALIVLVTLAAYQELESRFIVPRVYGTVLRLPAATVMISLLIGGKLLGILGALLALPVAAGIRMIAQEWRVELPGDQPEDVAVRLRDEQGERTFERRAAGAPATLAAAIATEIAEAQLDRDAAVSKVENKDSALTQAE